ncbi:hypothetical protein BH24ACT5_BH24ACT5_05640 [soil metagenome]
MSIVTAASESDFPSSGSLLLAQIRSQLVQFRRIPVALFFSLIFPLLLLLLFNTVLAGDDPVQTPAGDFPVRQFFVGSLAAFSAVSSTFTNLANMVPIRRQEGVLKRWRGTPTPRWVYLGGFVGSAVVVAAIGVIVMLAVGVVLYGTEIDPAKLPAAVVTFVIGVSAFSVMGVAVAALVRKPEAAPAVANVIILPMAFISNTFIPMDVDEMPRWLDLLGAALPLRPFVESLQAAFNPLVEAPAFQWSKLAVVAAWGLAAGLVAVRCFKWEPTAEDGQGPSRRRRRGPQ